MTAKEAIIIFCEEYQSGLLDKDGNLKARNKLREQWLQTNIKESEMQKFVFKVLKTVKSEYKVLPSIATFEEILNPKKTKEDIEDLEHLANIKFNELINKANSYQNFKTDDMGIQAGLNCIGGWIGICDSRKEDLKWLRKDFVKGFINGSNIQGETKIYRCSLGNSGKYISIMKDDNKLQIKDK